MILTRNVAVPVDGLALYANVFRPSSVDRVPAIVSATPYGKDKMPDRFMTMAMKLAGVRFGQIRASRFTGFEAPDPAFWTGQGYAVVQADVRGMHRSPGHAGVLTDEDARDYYDLIEWTGTRPWCSGAVGLCGVSYLAMSQWRVAPLRPPHLRAIVPWEGVTDLYREFAFQGGIPETGFVPTWWRFRMKRGHNWRYRLGEDFLAERNLHPFDDAYWAAKRPVLEQIICPALVCGSWSDQGLHTRGSFEGFSRIGSSQKWLFTHGRRKWETFYSDEARATQLRFFDHFLKDATNGWEQTPRVRLEVRRSLDQFEVRHEAQWPPSNQAYRVLYLDARRGALSPQVVEETGSIGYTATALSGNDRASFTLKFPEAIELTGEMSLKLWVSSSEGDDMDLFVLLRKLDGGGREVHFYGYNGFEKDSVAKGWLRVSHRATDPARSRPSRPWLTHRERQALTPGQIVAVHIEILPSSTIFEADSQLQLDVLGHDPARYPAFKHGASVNRGRHFLHTGGPFDAHLLIPVIERAEIASQGFE